ncbi:MAG TPA: hypothetical protein VFB15_00220 [Candidatus Binataceae bacterium]|jgi:hypothetical protein|nr:hypothetical protein [Candidatus Binataceae bacterium]
MKAIGNLAVILSAIGLMALLLVAQRNYQHSFGVDAAMQSGTSDMSSVTPQTVAAETVALN